MGHTGDEGPESVALDELGDAHRQDEPAPVLMLHPARIELEHARIVLRA